MTPDLCTPPYSEHGSKRGQVPLPERMGIFLPNWIGDIVMATPTLRALHTHFGSQMALVGIMRPTVSQVIAGTSWLSETVFFDPRSPNRDVRCWPLVNQLRELRLDTIILLTNSFRAGAIAWLSGARWRVGYATYGRGLLLNRKLYPPRNGWWRTPISAVDRYLQLAYLVGCPPKPRPRPLELATLEQDEQAADRVWEKLGLSGARCVVVLNTGGAYGPAKRWSDEQFAALARRIVTEHDARVLIICGPAEREAAAKIERVASHQRVRSLAREELSIGLSKASIRRCQLMVTTDSGPRHFAAAFKVPVVTLFGPTDPRWAETYSPGAIHLQHSVPCQPCAKRVCPLGHHACMRDLSVEVVYTAVLRGWQRDGARPAA